MVKIFLQTSESGIARLIEEIAGGAEIETLVNDPATHQTTVAELGAAYGQMEELLSRIDPDVMVVHPNDMLYIPGPSRTDSKIGKQSMIEYLKIIGRHGVSVYRNSGNKRIIPIIAIGDQEFRYNQEDVKTAIRTELMCYNHEVRLQESLPQGSKLRWYFNLFRPKRQTKFTPLEVKALRASLDYSLNQVRVLQLTP